MKRHLHKVGKTIRNPLCIWEDKERNSYRYYEHYPQIVLQGVLQHNKFIVVIVDRSELEVKTAFPTDMVKKTGEMIWARTSEKQK